VSQEPAGHQEKHRRQSAKLLVPALSGAFVVFAVFAVFKALAVMEVLSPGRRAIAGLLVGVALFVLIGYGVARRAAARTRGERTSAIFAGVMATYAGIVAGVLVWALGVEELILKRVGAYPLYEEHSLFPIEVVVWCVGATIPILAGIALARLSMYYLPAIAGPRD
jgi:hypothetical protein